jgi:hypothetical protein
MGTDARGPRFNESKVTAGNAGAHLHTLHVKVAATGDVMMQIAKCILPGGGTCPNT